MSEKEDTTLSLAVVLRESGMRGVCESRRLVSACECVCVCVKHEEVKVQDRGTEQH